MVDNCFDATNIIQKLNFDTRCSIFLLKNCTHPNDGRVRSRVGGGKVPRGVCRTTHPNGEGMLPCRRG